MKALSKRGVWLKLIAVSVLLGLIYLTYLVPLISPQENLHDLPVVLVNEDAAPSQANLGERLVEQVTDPQSPPSEIVEWTRFESRGEALDGIARGDYYAAIVIPENFSSTLATLATPTGPGSPAEIEIIANPAAGPTHSRAAQDVASEIVEHASEATSEQLVGDLVEYGLTVPAQMAPLIGAPIQPSISEAEGVGPNSGRGLTPAYLVFLAALSALMGAGAVHFGVSGIAASRTGLWSARLFLGLLLSLALAGIETWAAFSALEIEHEAPTFQAFGLLALLVYASMVVVLFFVTHLGPAGLALGAVFNIILGQIASGGSTPLQALPAAYQTLADWLPFRYATDGMRAFLFYDGGPPEVIHAAILALGAYLAIAALSGYAVAIIRDLLRRISRRRKGATPNVGKEAPIEA